MASNNQAVDLTVLGAQAPGGFGFGAPLFGRAANGYGNQNNSSSVIPANVDWNMDCSVCMEKLFSKGEAVVKVRGCNHYFHKSCLDRSIRTRRRDDAVQHGWGTTTSRCPDGDHPLGLVEPIANQSHTSSFLRLLEDDMGHTITGDSHAKQFVQCLLWSSIPTNTELLLRQIDEKFLPSFTFARRLPVVQESGMIPACMAIIKQSTQDNTSHAGVVAAATKCLRSFMELGDREESLRIMTQHLDGFYEALLSESLLRDIDATRAIIPLIRALSRGDGPLTQDSIQRFERLVPKILDMMKENSGEANLQAGGAAFLKHVCTADRCAQEIVSNGGLSVLFEAYRNHQLETADHTLQVLLSLPLRMD